MPLLQLMYFDLIDLNGTLPAEWGSHHSFQQLTDLYIVNEDPQYYDTGLYGGQTGGPLPITWLQEGSFPALETMWLVRFSLTGPLPTYLPYNNTLTTLVLDATHLTGTLPAEWAGPAAFQQLSTLHIDTSDITGLLPHNWGSPGSFPQLVNLTILESNITGTLPPEWAATDFWPSLAQLAISSNVMGTLPAEWSKLSAFQSLAVLDLSNNQLAGSLPATWPAHLDTLILNNNHFSGTLTHSGWPAQLRVLQIVQNRLTGTIPANLSWLQRLQMLRMDENMLTGQVPEEWGAADAFPGGLTVLSLFNNQLTGTLYNSWGSPRAFPSLQLLSLNGMGIDGTLPDSRASSMGAFRSLRILIWAV